MLTCLPKALHKQSLCKCLSNILRYVLLLKIKCFHLGFQKFPLLINTLFYRMMVAGLFAIHEVIFEKIKGNVIVAL